MQKIKTSKTLLLIYALFLYPIIIGRIALICYGVVYGIPLAYLLVNYNIVNRLLGNISYRYILVVTGIVTLFFLSIFVPVFADTMDFSYINVVLAIIRKAIILLFLIVITMKKSKAVNAYQFMYYFVLATCCYVFGTCVFLACPPLKAYWQAILGSSAYIHNLYSTYGYAARFGWSGFSGFRATLDCTIGIVFSLCLFFEKENPYRISSVFFTGATLTCFLGNLFYGRIGIIVSGICLLAGVILFHRIKIQQCLLFAVACLILGVIVLSVKDTVPALNDWYIWATTPIFNLLKTGSFNNYSANHLLNDMIFVPAWQTILHGDGWYTDLATGLHYMKTDVGFMRQLLFWGLGGTLLSYFIVFSSLTLLSAKHKVLITLLFIVFVIFEIKGEVYYEIIPVAFLLGLVERREGKEINKLE